MSALEEETIACHGHTTFAQDFESRAAKLLDSLNVYLRKHTELRKWIDPSRDGFVIMIPPGDYVYEKPDVDGQQLLDKIRKDYSLFCEILQTVLIGQNSDILQKEEQARKKVLKVLEQNFTWNSSKDEDFETARSAVKQQTDLLQGLHDPSNGSCVIIPDANALIHSPNLQEWKIEEVPHFCVLLLPTVLGELDEFKNHHRNENVRNKAASVIRQIKEYRRRGNLTEGVPIRAHSVNLRALAVEPDMSLLPAWLDPTVNDDRILAQSLEVIRHHPRSPIVIVTGDINLQKQSRIRWITVYRAARPLRLVWDKLIYDLLHVA